MVDAVILAGGTIPDREADFRAAVGVRCKSLIPLHGRIMVRYVIEALKGTPGIHRVTVVGPPELHGHPDCAAADVVLEESTGRSENLFLALDAFPDAERVLMVTSDTPMATPEMYQDILDHLPPEVDLGYVFVRGETVLAKFGDRPPPPPDETGQQMPNWVIMRLRDGRFTGTACLLFNRAAMEKCRTFVKGIFDNREMGNVIRTLRPIFGLGFLIRVGLAFRFPALGGLVSVAALERKLSRGLGLVCRGYVSPHAELAFDVDHVTDVPFAERVLKERVSP
jgi:GTP:adenosylcobinamide-phosphate guanylyltransferase